MSNTDVEKAPGVEARKVPGAGEPWDQPVTEPKVDLGPGEAPTRDGEHNDDNEYPDGGFTAWLQVLASHFIFPATVQYLAPRIGFPWAVRSSAFIAMFIAAMATLLIKPRLAPRTSGPWVEWGAFKEPAYVLFTTGTFFLFWALYFGFFYINAFARNIIGFSTVDAVALLLITNGLGIPSRPLAGYVADNFLGPINMFIINTAMLGVTTYCWAAVTTKTGMYIFSVFFGLANGACQGIFVGALASLTNDPQKMGTRFGMVATVTGFATLAGPPTAGAIIDRSSGDYLWAQVWGGTVTILGALTVAAARWWKTGWRWRVKI